MLMRCLRTWTVFKVTSGLYDDWVVPMKILNRITDRITEYSLRKNEGGISAQANALHMKKSQCTVSRRELIYLCVI